MFFLHEGEVRSWCVLKRCFGSGKLKGPRKEEEKKKKRMDYFWMYLGQGTEGHEIKTGFLFHCPIHHSRIKETQGIRCCVQKKK